MRTTIDLPQAIVDEAMKISRLKTKTAVIVTALEDFIRKGRIQGLKKFRGQVSLDLNLDKVRKRS